MLSECNQQENTAPVLKVVKVTPQSMAALIKSKQMKSLVPATLQINDEGRQIFRPVLGSLNY
jgi:hypothetical protein